MPKLAKLPKTRGITSQIAQETNLQKLNLQATKPNYKLRIN